VELQDLPFITVSKAIRVVQEAERQATQALIVAAVAMKVAIHQLKVMGEETAPNPDGVAILVTAVEVVGAV
jgi:hypothetical protein